MPWKKPGKSFPPVRGGNNAWRSSQAGNITMYTVNHYVENRRGKKYGPGRGVLVRLFNLFK